MTDCSVGVKVRLLGGFEIMYEGTAVRLPLGAQRLTASVALQDGGIHRAAAAERLWPDSPQRRAAANLRSALWYARRIAGRAVIECSGPRLRLAATVQVDLEVVLNRVHLIADKDSWRESPSACSEFMIALSHALLPDWPDEWLLLDRERWDQVRLHSLETLAQHLMSEKRYLPALEAAFAAVAIEPVRESAHRTVVEIYLAEGNSACALKHYQRYRGLLQRELGVTPSRQMTRLIHSTLAAV